MLWNATCFSLCGLYEPVDVCKYEDQGLEYLSFLKLKCLKMVILNWTCTL